MAISDHRDQSDRRVIEVLKVFPDSQENQDQKVNPVVTEKEVILVYKELRARQVVVKEVLVLQAHKVQEVFEGRQVLRVRMFCFKLIGSLSDSCLTFLS